MPRSFTHKGSRKRNIACYRRYAAVMGYGYLLHTAQAYFALTQDYGIAPSMSRRGNCYDNAMAENFFSILKTACIYRHKLKTSDEARQLIDDYIDFYSNEHIQIKTSLKPIEKRCQATYYFLFYDRLFFLLSVCHRAVQIGTSRFHSALYLETVSAGCLCFLLAGEVFFLPRTSLGQ